MNKKVFDLGLFVDDAKNKKRSNEKVMSMIIKWAFKCHGLTEKEILKIGLVTSDIWMKEIEVDEIETDLDKKHYDFEYSIISNFLKDGFHIRAIYDNNERTYILYYETDKFWHITNQCFNQLIPNIEHRPSGRPCEECYVWKD